MKSWATYFLSAPEQCVINRNSVLKSQWHLLCINTSTKQRGLDPIVCSVSWGGQLTCQTYAQNVVMRFFQTLPCTK